MPIPHANSKKCSDDENKLLHRKKTPHIIRNHTHTKNWIFLIFKENTILQGTAPIVDQKIFVLINDQKTLHPQKTPMNALPVLRKWSHRKEKKYGIKNWSQKNAVTQSYTQKSMKTENHEKKRYYTLLIDNRLGSAFYHCTKNINNRKKKNTIPKY